MTTYTVQYWAYDGSEGDDAGPSVLFSSFTTSDERRVLDALDDEDALAPSAYDMPILDVIHQVNNVNGGELVVLVDGKRYGTD